MRSLLLLSAVALTLVVLAPSAAARPLPVETYPCFNGGTTVVVNGQTLLTCFEAVEVQPCPNGGGAEVRVAGQVVWSQCDYGPPPA
jgi:hypothetical protein